MLRIDNMKFWIISSYPILSLSILSVYIYIYIYIYIYKSWSLLIWEKISWLGLMETQQVRQMSKIPFIYFSFLNNVIFTILVVNSKFTQMVKNTLLLLKRNEHNGKKYLPIIFYITLYMIHSISFQTFLYRQLKLSETLENSVCYCSTSWDDWPIFMISHSKEQLQQQLEYNWWI